VTFHDVIRHLVEHGPFASDADRDAARAAVDEHEAQAHAAVTSVAGAGEPAAQ